MRLLNKKTEVRSQKSEENRGQRKAHAQRFLALCLIGMVFASIALAQTYPATHDHLRGRCKGELRFNEGGVAFESARKQHSWKVPYLDIQQAKALDTGEFRLVTYKDRKWRLGLDREYRLQVADKQFASKVGPLLEKRLERRFVSGFVEGQGRPLWELPAKHLLRLVGTEGSLAVFDDRIVYRAATPGDSRTWLLSDIDNVSTSDPYQLTIVTHERARSHYGGRKGFNFQLKQPLAEERYNDLWRWLEKSKQEKQP